MGDFEKQFRIIENKRLIDGISLPFCFTVYDACDVVKKAKLDFPKYKSRVPTTKEIVEIAMERQIWFVKWFGVEP